MDICAVYCVYNEEDTLAISMRSIKDLVDRYVIVDGRFIGYPDFMPVNSTDRTVEIAKRFPNVEVVQLTEALHQCDVRDKFANVGADWTIEMAGHQIMYGDIRRLRHELSYNRDFMSVSVPVYPSLEEFVYHKTYNRCRIWHRNSGMHRGGHHWVMLDKGGRILDGMGFIPNYVWILTLHELRSEERAKAKEEYLQWRSANPNARW